MFYRGHVNDYMWILYIDENWRLHCGHQLYNSIQTELSSSSLSSLPPSLPGSPPSSPPSPGHLCAWGYQEESCPNLGPTDWLLHLRSTCTVAQKNAEHLLYLTPLYMELNWKLANIVKDGIVKNITVVFRIGDSEPGKFGTLSYW